jgi:hypothetical protein
MKKVEAASVAMKSSYAVLVTPDYILHMESLEEDVRMLLEAVVLTLVF